MTEPFNTTALTFDSCDFTLIASKYGGAIYLFFIVESIDLSPYYPVFPTISLDSCNSTHVYAS